MDILIRAKGPDGDDPCRLQDRIETFKRLCAVEGFEIESTQAITELPDCPVCKPNGDSTDAGRKPISDQATGRPDSTSVPQKPSQK